MRVARIELAQPAWEADILPLNYTRKILTGFSISQPRRYIGEEIGRSSRHAISTLRSEPRLIKLI